MSTTTVPTRIAQENGDLILLETGDELLADGLFSDVFTPGELTATVDIPSVSIVGGATVSPNALELTLSTPNPSILIPDARVQVSALTLTLSTPAPTVVIPKIVEPDELTITWSAVTPTVAAQRFVTIVIDDALGLTLVSVDPKRAGGIWQPIGREDGAGDWSAIGRSGADEWTAVARVE